MWLSVISQRITPIAIIENEHEITRYRHRTFVHGI